MNFDGVRFKFVFNGTNAGEVIDKGYWHSGDELLFTCQRTPMASDYRAFPHGKRTGLRDVLLTRNGTPYVHLPPPGAIYSNVVQRVTLREGVNREYLSYALGSACLALRGEGVSIESFKLELWKELLLWLPTLPTQKAIADFLDRKTAAIDALIETKQKLLDLLAEKRAALINQAVTKGLDPNVPMKDSGIPWIGEIPAHWVVKRLQFACVLQRGFDLPSQARADGDVPIYGGGGITGHHAQAMVMPPGVVTGRYGTIGEVHLVDVPFWPLNTSLYVKQFWGNNAAYIRHLLSAAPMKMYSAKSAVPGVDRNDVHVIPVGMPPVPEQETIVAQLDARLAGLDEVVGAISTHVGRLQEYRQALITAAVTGKLRVEAAP